jgi:YVTN family beta-propeller protein
MRRRLAHAATILFVIAACARTAESPGSTDDARRLPTGARLDPAGRSVDVGSMPLAMTLSPDGRHVVLLLNGWREQGLQVLDRANGVIVQTVPQAAAFIGLAFSPRANVLFVSGGNQDVVYGYDWKDGRATLRDSVILAWKADARRSGTRYPAGLAVSPDGTRLYVAENLADSLAVVDLGTGAVLARHATERYPYGVAVAPNGDVYVSAWGGHTVSVFTPNGSGGLDDGGRIRVARHPSALVLNADGSRLFVASGSTDRIAVVDTRGKRLVKHLDDPPPEGPAEGSTPNALALSRDGKRLFVAEADANSIGIFDLSAVTSNDTTARGNDLLAGRIPVGWYPTALALAGDTLWVVNGKGRGTGPNPNYPHPGGGRTPPTSYTLGQVSGTVTLLPDARVSGRALAAYTDRVARANNWTSRTPRTRYPPIEHVVYVIKENRTYDQVLGDLPQADGDTSLLFFGRDASPNHHALAERFGIYDRFFVNAEVSADGHNWSAAAYATDYVQKTTPSNYSSRGRSYDYEGTNRCASEQTPCEPAEDDVAEPASGYLWDLAQRAGITFRNYGEFVIPEGIDPQSRMPTGYKGSKPFLMANTSREFPGYDLDIPDQRRADVFLKEFAQFVRDGRMPKLMILRLPNDHTAGARANAPTPRAYMADNDLALGRVVEAISRSPFWRSTAIFVLEDDAQNGPDHVDSHRSPFFLISPWARPGVHHRFTNTTDVIATIEEILGLGSLSQFDYYGRPLRDVWTESPDASPYRALTPAVPLDERNPSQGRGARESERLDLAFEDIADEDLFNQILWRAIKGDDVPFPGVTRMSALEWKRAR